MFAANTYVIRKAAESDAEAIRRLSELDSRKAPTGYVLIGEIEARPAVAISVEDGHVVADPFAPTAQLTAMVRMRANALRAYWQTPSVSKRVRAGVRLHRPASAAPAA